MKLAKEKKEMERRMEEKKKMIKAMENREKNMKLRPVNKITTAKSSQPRVKSHKVENPGEKYNRHKYKCNRPFCWELENEEKGQVLKTRFDSQRIKPRPLDFRVDMLDKGFMHSPHKKRKNDFEMR